MNFSNCALSVIVGCLTCMPCGAADNVILPPYLDPANRKTMPPEELAEWTSRWDEIVKTSLFDAPIPMAVMKNPDGSYFRVLEYNNPEIVERVVSLCIAENQRELAARIKEMEEAARGPHVSDNPKSRELNDYNLAQYRAILDESVGRSGKRFNEAHVLEFRKRGGEGELYIDFHDAIFPAAESTLDEELCFYVLLFQGGSELRNDYLAYVRPADTLRTFLDSELGGRNGRKIYPEYLFFPGPYGSEPVDDAMEVLFHMVEKNPPFHVAEAANIRTFVRRHALHFADPSLPKKRDREHTDRRIYHPHQDFQTRAHALKILQFVGDENDLDLVHQIPTSPPIPETPEPRKYRPIPVPLEDLAREAEAAIHERATQGAKD